MARRYTDWMARAALAAVVAFALPSAVRAAPGGFYTGAVLIGSAAFVDESTFSGFPGIPEVEQRNDGVAGAGLTVGYQFADVPVRVELEGHYRHRFDHDVLSVGTPTIGYGTDLATVAALVNVVVEGRNASSFTPFMGVSFGIAHNRSYTERAVQGAGFSTNNTKGVTGFAWGVIAGVDWAFSDDWRATASYRYIDLGRTETGVFSTGESIRNDEYVGHDVMLGIRYEFN